MLMTQGLRLSALQVRARSPGLLTKVVASSCSVNDDPMPLIDVEEHPVSGTAMRVLYSALTPLDNNAPRMQYTVFTASIDEDVRRAMDLSDVLQFIRESLSVAPEKVLLIVPMVDEGNAAEKCFGSEKLTPDGHQVIKCCHALWLEALGQYFVFFLMGCSVSYTFANSLTASCCVSAGNMAAADHERDHSRHEQEDSGPASHARGAVDSLHAIRGC